MKVAKFFEEMKIHKHIVYNTYKETTITMDLIEYDAQIFNIFQKARNLIIFSQLWKFFA